MSDLVDLEHWRSFVRVDPVGPGGFKPAGQGKATLVTYVGDKHPGGRRVVGAELTRPQAEGFCAAIMACFEEPEPSQEEFLHEPEEEDHDEALSETLRGVPGAFERYARILEAKVPKCPMGYELPCRWNEDGGDCETCAFGVPAGHREPVRAEEARHRRISGLLVSTAAPPDLSEEDLRGIEEDLRRTREALDGDPYWRKSFTVTPPPEGLEGGLAETAVVVQAKHGAPVPMTASQVEEFVDAIENSAIAGEQERMNRLADLSPIDDRPRKPEDPVEEPDEKTCGRCGGTGWFAPAPERCISCRGHW